MLVMRQAFDLVALAAKAITRKAPKAIPSRFLFPV
jgi:hypothetical protein